MQTASMGELFHKLLVSSGKETSELVYKVLSVDRTTNTYSSVLIVKMGGLEQGYIWIDEKSGSVSCHSNALAGGPMSSAERKSYRIVDPELERELRATIMAICNGRS
jgi:hypothetical protein